MYSYGYGGGVRKYAYNYRYGYGGKTTTHRVVDPYAAHVASMRSAAPSASGLYTAQDYTASLSQAGKFVDAFGGGLSYTSPNVQASPTRVVDGTSGLAYVSADGAEDTAIGSAAQTVAAWTMLLRSPVSVWLRSAGCRGWQRLVGHRRRRFNALSELWPQRPAGGA